MRSWTLLLGALCLLLPAVSFAEQDPAAAEEAVEAIEANLDPVAEGLDAAAEATAEVEAGDAPVPSDADAEVGNAAEAAAAEIDALPVADESAALENPVSDAVATEAPVQEIHAAVDTSGLGPMAVDADGQVGRIHTVVGGDTLWDISTAYLGTPWVWPSVWTDNDEIQNPHVIQPGDNIWITSGEMRIVSDAQAAEMLSAKNDLDAADVPAELADTDPMAEEDLMDEAVPAAMEQLSVASPLTPEDALSTGRTIHVAEREAMGFVTTKAIEASTSILDSPADRIMLVDGDRVVLAVGEGEVEVGDQFTVFRDAVPVRDYGKRHLLGYHVDVLGWAEVREVQGETCIAELRMTQAEVNRGDNVMPREDIELEVPIRLTPEGIEGHIVFMPNSRTTMADGDYVYLNRGVLHGFEVGSEIEVYDPGHIAKDRVKGAKVMTPDHVVANLVLVEVKPDTSVAFIMHASRELAVGDRIRAHAPKMASR